MRTKRSRRGSGGMRMVAAGIVAVTALGLDPGLCRAQELAVGVRGGLNGATVAWSESPLGEGLDRLERRRAFTGGGWVAVPVTGRLGLRAEILWAGKGFVERSPGETTTLDVRYVEVPAFVTVAVPVPSDRLVPELYAGAWVARETSCDVRLQAEGLDVELPCDDLPDDDVLRRTTDWGMAFGGALAVRGSGPVRGLLDVRYSAGLRNIDASPAVDNFDIRHRGVSVLLGLGIEVGR